MTKDFVQSGLVVVCGANGFTGRFVCKELQKRGINFIALVRPHNDITWLEKNCIRTRFADLNNSNQLEKSINDCYALINIASLGFGSVSTILKACKKVGIKRTIFVSTTGIFTKLNNKSKSIRLDAEDQIKKSDLNYTIIRPTMIFGSIGDRNIVKLISWIHRFPVIPVFNKGNAIQQPIFVQDLAWAIVSSFESNKTINKTFNIAGSRPITFNEMIDEISKVFKKKVLRISINAKIAIMIIFILKTLKFKLPISEEQIKRVVEDKKFSNEQAFKLINFKPREFDYIVRKEIKEYLNS